jgi:IS5 family transposase
VHHYLQKCTEKLSLLLVHPSFALRGKVVSRQPLGEKAKSFRMALGALIIKEKLGVSDRETVEQIRENPYLQYFIGQSTYSNELPFDPSLLVHFRQRIGANLINKVNERTIKKMREITADPPEKKKDSDEKNESSNRGKLIVDAG